MINLDNLGSYMENNRIEAKKALGGFPQSLWETYSAFANTLGGIILLGVEEEPDHSLRAVDLPDPARLINFFLSTVNDRSKVSVNVLAEGGIREEIADGKRIVVITIPRAHRFDKPVYIGGNAQSGTYRRCGEGDYRCTAEEVLAMQRDAAVKTQDMKVLSSLPLSCLQGDSVDRYRQAMKLLRPSLARREPNDEEFLYMIGAAARKNGQFHPTAAGLLMFGTERDILGEYPQYALKYSKIRGGRVTKSVRSGCGGWSGNLFDFYFRVREEIASSIAEGAQIPAKERSAATAAACEALANCITNADYYGKRGIAVSDCEEGISFRNPGGFRIDVGAAKAGGVSDPRNVALLKMFSLINIGERAGNGIMNIFALWKRLGLTAPSIEESFSPETITFTLPTVAQSRKRPRGRLSAGAQMTARRAAVIEYLTDHAYGTQGQLCELLGVSAEIFEKLADGLAAEDIITSSGDGDGRVLRLKR